MICSISVSVHLKCFLIYNFLTNLFTYWLLSWLFTYWLLRLCCLVSMYLWIFQFSSYYLYIYIYIYFFDTFIYLFIYLVGIGSQLRHTGSPLCHVRSFIGAHRLSSCGTVAPEHEGSVMWCSGSVAPWHVGS